MNVTDLEKLLDSKFEGQNKWLKEKFDGNEECHKDVIEQVKYTNGRVRRLEKLSYLFGGVLLALGWQVANATKIKEFLIAFIK